MNYRQIRWVLKSYCSVDSNHSTSKFYIRNYVATFTTKKKIEINCTCTDSKLSFEDFKNKTNFFQYCGKAVQIDILS